MLNSLKKNKTGIILMVLSSVFACVGQLFWKLQFTNGIWFLFIGFCFYGIGALLMLFAYKFGSLSVLQPILSLNYVFALVLGYVILQETISIQRIIGTLLIMLGVFLIGGGE